MCEKISTRGLIWKNTILTHIFEQEQWGRNETFLREYLFNKVFWSYEFSAKNISTFHKFKGVTGQDSGTP